MVALHILQAGSLATQTTQIIKLSAADFGRFHHIHFIHDFRSDGEDALNAVAEADLAHGEAGLRAAVFGDDNALKRLKTLFVAFFNLYLHADGVARDEIRNISALGFG